LATAAKYCYGFGTPQFEPPDPVGMTGIAH
jgi:hypothetical protein